MRNITAKASILYLVFELFSISSAFADIYRWVDEEGRIQFSDSPNPNYASQALLSTTGDSTTGDSTTGDSTAGTSTAGIVSHTTDIKSLQKTAKKLKKERLARARETEKLFQNKRRKRLKKEKILAKKKSKKEACDNAREKENLAFKQRGKSRNLTAMRKALARYEKKRMIRINKCK